MERVGHVSHGSSSFFHSTRLRHDVTYLGSDERRTTNQKEGANSKCKTTTMDDVGTNKKNYIRHLRFTMNNPSNANGTLKKYKGIQNGWFTERATMWPGQKFSLALQV